MIYKPKMLLYILFSHFLIGFDNTSGYDLKCPDVSQLHFRACGICRRFTSTFYTCLLDTNTGKYLESCNQAPDFSSPGEKYVISGARTTVSCFLGKYQPFALWANKSSDCIYKKSKCNEEGQIQTDNNFAITDRACMCDYEKGFHYISNPANQCACVPSEEDCSCYYDPRRRLNGSDHLCLHTSQTTENIAVDIPRDNTKNNPATIERLKPVRSTGFRAGFLALLVMTVLTGLILKYRSIEINFVGAIDIGTTSSVYAYCTAANTLLPKNTETNIKLNKLWNSGDRDLCSFKTPTCILLNKHMDDVSIGYDAQKKYSDYVYDNEATDFHYVDKFKMELYHNENISDKLQIKDVKGNQIPAIKVFSNMIYKLKERLERDIQNEYTGSSFSPRSIQWVLTIPAKWTDRAESFIRKCAEKAGIRNEQLRIIIESESASVYIHHLLISNKLDLPMKELPTAYLVIDLGGGTNDITAHKISKRGNLKELCKPSGNVHGGTKVDKYLFSCFETIVGCEVVRALKDKGSYLELLEQFESIKNLITSSNAKKVACKIPLNLLNELCEKYNKKTFNVLLGESNYCENMSLANDRLRIDRKFIEGYISEVASDIIEDIKYVLLEKAQSKNITTFFVVGGFSNSKLVRQKLSDEFPKVNIIYPPEDVELTVVRGAVLYGKNPNYIKPSSNKTHLR